MIRNFDDICKAMFAKMDEYSEKYGSHENWPREVIKNDKQLKFIHKLNNVYINAQAKSVRFGLVGVGAISYAEYRLRTYQKRLAAKIA